MKQSRHPSDEVFAEFVGAVEPRLRRALFAALGVDRGREATAEALAWAWINWDKLARVSNATGYLFRVGQSRTRMKRVPAVFVRAEWHEPVVEPDLGSALADLSERQRIAVILVHGCGWTLREVAEFTGTQITTIQTHLDRGLKKLRSELEVHDHE